MQTQTGLEEFLQEIFLQKLVSVKVKENYKFLAGIYMIILQDQEVHQQEVFRAEALRINFI